MGYAQALLGRDYRREQESLQRKAKKKGLWGSVGRTLGGIAATALTGGAAAPWAAGLMAGAGTAIGGAIGAGASGVNLKGGTFMQKERAGLEKQLGAFGEANIVGGLKAGLTAGMGQASKLRKADIKGKGLDFKGSFVGEGIEKGKLSTMRGFQGQYEAEQLATMRGAQAGYEAEQLATATKELSTMRGAQAGYEALPDVKAGIEQLSTMRGAQGQYEALPLGQKPRTGEPTLWSKFQEEDWLGKGAKKAGDYFKNKARDKRMSRDISLGGTSGRSFPDFGKLGGI